MVDGAFRVKTVQSTAGQMAEKHFRRNYFDEWPIRRLTMQILSLGTSIVICYTHHLALKCLWSWLSLNNKHAQLTETSRYAAFRSLNMTYFLGS